MDFVLDTSAREKRWAPARLPPQAPPTELRPQAVSTEHKAVCMTRSAAGWVSLIQFLSLPPLILPFLVLFFSPLRGQVAQVLWQRGLSALCRCARCSREPAGDRPLPWIRLPPPSPSPSFHAPPSPTLLCWLLHLSLTLGFRVLTVHSALFISSSLSFKRRRPADDWLGLLQKIFATSCSGCWDSICPHPPCLAGQLSNDCPSWWLILQMCR